MTNHRYRFKTTTLHIGATAYLAVSVSVFATPPEARAGDADSNPASMEEITITAQKKAELLQDVPVPVSVITTQLLNDTNQWRLQDYVSKVPGLNMMPAGQSEEEISIRGITTGPGLNPTVGVVVDDVAYGAGTDLVGANAQPNLDPSDIERIEVLRGPQGALYGASSMGGLLKYVTVDPSTKGFSGRVEAGTNAVYNGDGPGYNFSAAANVPLNDSLAVRASAFTRKNPGYIDSPTFGIRGINWAEISGGRLSSLWQPTESTSLKLSALYQRYTGGGTNDADPTLGDLKQFFAYGVGPFQRTSQAYSATLNTKLGGVDLTSITGYNVSNVHDTSDFSPYLGESLILPVYGVSGLPLYNHFYTRKFSQEVRLSASAGNSIDWVLGGFYTHERSEFHSDAYAADLLTGRRVDDILIGNDPVTYTEFAAFGAVTYHFTDQFNVQVGGRQSRIKQTFMQTEAGSLAEIIYTADPFVYPHSETTSDVFTYLVTPQFKLSHDVMLYARFASGYRPGGLNVSQGIGTPPQYDPDRTYNYEIGIKGNFPETGLSIDASVYRIIWKNLQIQLVSPVDNASYLANGSTAKSDGVELSVESKPWKGLTLAGWVDYDHAILTEDFPSNSTAYGVNGNRLPFNTKFSGHLNAEQQFPLGQSVTGYVAAEMSYVGARLGSFTSSADRQYYPSYVQTDLRTGLFYGPWTTNIYVNNVTDKRGLLGGGLGSFSTATFYYLQPRTVGLSVSKSF